MDKKLIDHPETSSLRVHVQQKGMPRCAKPSRRSYLTSRSWERLKESALENKIKPLLVSRRPSRW